MFGQRRPGRLVHHYFLISFILIGGGLITSGALEIYFRYHETRERFALLQQEITAGAAFKIERFIQEIERTLRATTKSREIAHRGLSPEYRFEMEKLLIVARAVTEAVAFDRDGVERVRVSRFRALGPREGAGAEASPAFAQAVKGRSHLGPVYFVRDSEPYMTIAVPIERFAGDVIGVLKAEVNLKYVWEVVSEIKVGSAGYAYAVSRNGDLIAHPDISLVLQRRNLAHLDQVRAAFQPALRVAKPRAEVAGSVPGTQVFTSHTLIPNLDWAVLIEQPVGEIYGPLYASMLRTSALLLVGLGVALFAGFFVARRVVRPLGALREGVERIGWGDLSYRLQLETGDEIEVLAEEFNRMTAALQEAYAGLEQKVAERTQALLVANEKLDDASRHKSRFLASVSHELRTPLNAIIGFTRVVLRKTEGQIAGLQRENLHKVLISAEHLLTLINGLLDLSRIEAGRMDIVPKAFKLDEVLDVAVSTVEPMLKSGRVQLVREIAPGLPPLDTDREKLQQILLNLLANAAKFTEDGEIKVSAWQEEGSLKLVVADTGIGMEREALGYIFDEFRRVESAGAQQYPGTGLGLAITRQLVRLLGGKIAADSEVGKGSTFMVLIPIRFNGSTTEG